MLRGDFTAFYKRELGERRDFQYPPFHRLIHITLQHKDDKTVYEAAGYFAGLLRKSMGNRVLGPVQPHIPRIRGFYNQDILLKLEKSAPVIRSAKDLVRRAGEAVTSRKGRGQVRIGVDVDPV